MYKKSSASTSPRKKSLCDHIFTLEVSGKRKKFTERCLGHV